MSADLLNGGSGTDTATYRGAQEGVQVDLRFGSGSGGDAEGDTLVDIERVLVGSSDDILIGNADANVLDGGRGDDSLTGFAGDDVLRGKKGDDDISGGADDDRLFGGDGRDSLISGAGADYLSGGAGGDDFVWTALSDSGAGAKDRVADFETTGGDHLDFTAFGASYAGNGPFAGGGEASVIWRATAADNTAVLLDADGDATADLSVLLLGVTTLTQGDFLL